MVLIRQRGRRIGPAGKAVARIGSGEPVLVILLQITEKVDPITGVRSRSRQIIFPRFHQWEAVTSLLETTSAEGGLARSPQPSSPSLHRHLPRRLCR